MMFLLILKGLEEAFPDFRPLRVDDELRAEGRFFHVGEDSGQAVDVGLQIGDVLLIPGVRREVGVQDPLVLRLRLRHVGEPRLKKLLEDPLCPHLREIVRQGLGHLGGCVDLEADPFLFCRRGFVHAARHDASFRLFPVRIGEKNPSRDARAGESQMSSQKFPKMFV